MRNLLEESSVAQCLDGERLKGRLLSPIAESYSCSGSEARRARCWTLAGLRSRNSAESGSIEVSLVLNSLPTQHQSKPSPLRVVCHERRVEYPRRATAREMKMLWGKRRGCGTFGAVQQTDG